MPSLPPEPEPEPDADDPVRRRVLDAADELFYRRGLTGVGMDDVRDAAGVSLRRLYRLHPTKRDLVAAWLRDRHVRWMGWFTAAIDGAVRDGVPPPVAALDAIEQWVGTPGYRGCAFLNTAAEPAQLDDELRAIVAGHLRELEHVVHAAIARARPGAPEWLSEAVAVLVDGAIVRSMVLGSAAPVVAARSAAALLLPWPPCPPSP